MSQKINNLFMTLSNGQMLLGDFEILSEFAKGKNTIVELGTCCGLSTMVLAANSSANGCQVVTVDNYQYLTTLKGTSKASAEESLVIGDIASKFLELFYGVKLIISSTVDARNLFDDETIDLLYIDAGHDYVSVKSDYDSWFRKVKSKGNILFHDYNDVHQEVKEFIDFEIRRDIDSGLLKEIKTNIENETAIFVVEKI